MIGYAVTALTEKPGVQPPLDRVDEFDHRLVGTDIRSMRRRSSATDARSTEQANRLDV